MKHSTLLRRIKALATTTATQIRKYNRRGLRIHLMHICYLYLKSGVFTEQLKIAKPTPRAKNKILQTIGPFLFYLAYLKY